MQVQRYAILDENDLVINVTEASEALEPSWVEGPQANIGQKYDRQTKTFAKVVVAKSFEELCASYEKDMSAFLDAKALEYGYDNRMTIMARTGYDGPFRQECVHFSQWMDASYVKMYDLINEIKDGQWPTPPEFDLIASSFDELVKPAAA